MKGSTKRFIYIAFFAFAFCGARWAIRRTFQVSPSVKYSSRANDLMPVRSNSYSYEKGSGRYFRIKDVANNNTNVSMEKAVLVNSANLTRRSSRNQRHHIKFNIPKSTAGN